MSELQPPQKQALELLLAGFFPVFMAPPTALAGWMTWFLSQSTPQEAREVDLLTRLIPLSLSLLLIAAVGVMLRMATDASGIRTVLRSHWRLFGGGGLLFVTTLLLTWHLLVVSPTWGGVNCQMLTLVLAVTGLLLSFSLVAAIAYWIASRIEARS